MNINTLLKKFWVFSKYFVLLFLLFTISGVVIYRFIPVPFTSLMFQRMCEDVGKGRKIHICHKWVPYEKISPYMIQAVIASEDNNFVHHFGIDYEAIQKAYEHNKKGRRIRGASTITQQTSKNVFLWIDRTYLRKSIELYYTYMIEIIWGKHRIMEVYLNSIEMGDGIFGIESASLTYFHKHASKLTKGEAAIIAAAFPNPRKRNPASPGGYLVGRQQAIMNLMSKLPPVEL